MSIQRIAAVVVLCGGFAACSAAEEPRYAGKPMASWLNDLQSEDPLICEEAIVVLTEAGPAARAAVPRLEALTRDRHRRLRFRAGLALWQIAGQKKPAIAALTEAVRDPTTPGRIGLLHTLTDFGPDAISSASTILELADDADVVIASQSMVMIPRLGPGIAPLLAAELDQKDLRRRRRAAEALAQLGASGGEAAAALRRGLDADDTLLRTACARALWGQGQTTETVVAVLREAARNGDNAQRGRILATFIYVHRSKEGAPVLKELMRGGDLLCRVQAARQLQAVDPQPETVLPVYVEGLKDGTTGSRIEAARGLTDLGPAAHPALPALIELLKRPDDGSLMYVHNALLALGEPAVPPLIELLLGYKNDTARSRPVTILLSQIGAPAVPGILPLLSHAEASTRATGCRALGFMGPDARKAVPKLTQLLGDKDQVVRREAVTALGRIGPAARPATRALVDLARDSNVSVRSGAMQALEQIQPDPKLVRPVAVEALEDRNRYVRVRAVSLLWHLDPKDADVMPRVLELLNQPLTRLAAVELVGEMGPEAAAALPSLIQILANRDFGLRLRVVVALGHLGSAARPAVPALVELLSGGEAALRGPILEALLQIDSNDSARIVPAVLATAKQDRTNARTLCLRVLARHGRKSAAAVPWIVDELHRPTDNYTISLANALIDIDRERARKELMPLLREMLKGAVIWRLPAAGALLRMQADSEEALRLLIEGLQGQEFYPRQQAAELLAAAGPPARAAVPALRRALRDPKILVRVHAADALYRIAGETETTVPVLIEALKPSPLENYPRQQAAVKLGDMGPAARAALPALRGLRQDNYPDVRFAVLAALRKIDPPASSKP